MSKVADIDMSAFAVKIIRNITKTCLFKYNEIFTIKKWKFTDEKFWKIMYTPVNPSFTI